MKIYLAHPLELRAKIREIELSIEKETEIELLNPFYDTDRDDIYAIDKGEKTRSSEDLDFRAIVKKDLASINSCDSIVAYIKRGTYSLGTLFEVWNTVITTTKPIYIVSPDSLMHPWIRYIIDASNGRGFDSWDEFKQMLLDCEY